MGTKINRIETIFHIPFLEELKKNEECWSWNISISEDKEILSIPLLKMEESEFPVTYKFLKEMEVVLDADLKMATYVLLPGGKEIYPHIDDGEFYKDCDRYHFMVQGICQMTVEDEDEIFCPGNLYWFDNTLMYDVKHIGCEDRIVLIFDMLKDK